MTIDLAYGDNKNTIFNFESYFEVRRGLGRCCIALHYEIVLGSLSLVLDQLLPTYPSPDPTFCPK